VVGVAVAVVVVVAGAGAGVVARKKQEQQPMTTSEQIGPPSRPPLVGDHMGTFLLKVESAGLFESAIGMIFTRALCTVVSSTNPEVELHSTVHAIERFDNGHQMPMELLHVLVTKPAEYTRELYYAWSGALQCKQLGEVANPWGDPDELWPILKREMAREFAESLASTILLRAEATRRPSKRDPTKMVSWVKWRRE
jgi:hypothetical protein